MVDLIINEELWNKSGGEVGEMGKREGKREKGKGKRKKGTPNWLTIRPPSASPF